VQRHRNAFDFTEEPELWYGADGEIAVPRREIFWCAPSVEIFAYRFLIEARLVSAIRDKKRASELDPDLLCALRAWSRRPLPSRTLIPVADRHEAGRAAPVG
jgi:hypothetical protein